MDGQSRLAGEPVVWRVAAVLAVLAINVAVLWVVVFRDTASPPTEPTNLPTGARMVDQPPSGSAGSFPERVPPEADVMVTVTPSTSRTLTVVERVRAAPRVRRLLLSPPSASTREPAPRVLDLAILADGETVAVPGPAGGRWLVALPRRTASVVLSYRLEGAVERRPSAPDQRAMLHLSPLASPAAADASVVLEIQGVTVRNLVCPDRPLPDQLCGRSDGDRWRTSPLPVGEATVIAQVDLPTVDLPT